MELTKEQKVAAAYFAAKSSLSSEDIYDFLACFSDVTARSDNALHALLEALNTPKLQRALSRAGQIGQRETKNRLVFTVGMDDCWYRGDELIGYRLRLYKSIQPYEMQAKVAYDVFYQAALDFLSGKYQILPLDESEYVVDLFIPAGCENDFDQLWSEIVNHLFSMSSLQQTFIPLMKSVKLTNRGFSALDMPIMTQSQAEVLAGFDLINLRSLMNGDRKKQTIINALTAKLEDNNLDEKERDRLEKQRSDIEKKLTERLARYSELYAQWDWLLDQKPEWAKRVENAARFYESGVDQPTAGQQIAKAGAKIGKAVGQITELGVLVEKSDFVSLEPLLFEKPIEATVLPGGDSNTKMCYACGRTIKKGDPVYKANTFIFASPSQRLQSGGSQTEPKICGACAAVSFISPIKLGEGRLVLRLRELGASDEKRYMADSHLKMFALGDLNIVAGQYAMLQANETIGNDPLIDKLGGVQYAIYKIATIFSSPTVFHEFEPEVVIGESTVSIPSRHVVWMQQLIEIFNLNRKWVDKAQFNALGRAIRHLQKEDIVSAVYELLRSGVISTQQIGLIKSIQLEDLRLSHWKELNDMSTKSIKAQFYKDVAAMTGLHYAFCRYIYSKTSGNDRRIAVRKAIERSDDPYQFSYTEANETASDSAILRYSAADYFIYQEAGLLLSELEIDVAQRRDFSPESRVKLKLENQEATQLYIDDLINAHAYLVEIRYSSTKAQREFFYALKLSLHAHFPDLLENDSDKETE